MFQNFAVFFISPERWIATKTSSWCVFIYIRASLWETKRGCGCCTYRRGLSALFVPGSWHCEGLEHGTDEGKIPAPFLYIFFQSYIYQNQFTYGNLGETHSVVWIWFMQDSLSNVFFTTKDAASLGSLPNCVVPVPMSIKYSTKRILISNCFGVYPASSITTSSETCPIQSTSSLLRILSPNRRHICHPLGTTCFPFLMFLSHTFATY